MFTGYFGTVLPRRYISSLAKARECYSKFPMERTTSKRIDFTLGPDHTSLYFLARYGFLPPTFREIDESAVLLFFSPRRGFILTPIYSMIFIL